MSELESLKKEIGEAKERIKPLEERLNALYRTQAEECEAKRKKALLLQDSFTLDELVFSAEARCQCGAGLAYPKNIGGFGSWDCADILLGRAKPIGHPESKGHDGAFPFAFYNILSENQKARTGGLTTRPSE
jgi:hypothetical protein